MKVAKHKRNISKKLPIIIFSLMVLLFFLFFMFLIFTKFFNNSFLSPLAQHKIYKTNSIQDVLQKNNILFEKIEIATDSSYIVSLKDDGQVNISSKKDISSQISSLQLIISRLTIEGKKFKRLDLRFDKPIIEF
ncbi:MAG: hypothetical protein AAB931_00175 [Patescibacteria group bacterium]